MTNIKELREKRAKLVADARKLIEAAKADGRDAMNAEEREQWDAIMADVDKMADQIGVLERQQEVEQHLEQSAGRKVGNVEYDEETREVQPRRGTEEYRKAFQSYLRGGWNGLNGNEMRALSMDDDVQGGFLIAPMQLSSDLIKALDNAVFMRRLGSVETIQGVHSLGIPTLDADPADADWVSELSSGTEDSTMAFGRRELNPHQSAKRLKVSNKLLQRSTRGVEALVRERLSYKFGITEEKAFLSGDGAAQPLGIFTASADGIPTSRDEDFANATTIDADSLIDGLYGLKAGYRRSSSAGWICHRDFVKRARKLKGSDNNYLWQPGLQAQEPDRLLGLPVHESEYAPNTFTTGKYVAVVGDFRFYQIVQADMFMIQRLNELYAETGQTGFIAHMYVDGMPTLAEAFVRMKMG